MTAGTPNDPVHIKGVQWYRQQLLLRDNQISDLREVNSRLRYTLKLFRDFMKEVNEMTFNEHG